MTTNDRWGRMDFAISQRRDISATAKVVYAVLKCFENDETGRCNPTQTMIAADAGAGIASVKRAIKQLVEVGIIEVDRTPGSSRYTYRIMDGTVQNDTSQTVQNDTSNSPKWYQGGIKMIPQTVQNDTSLHNKDDKNRKEQEKNRKEARGREVIKEPGYIQPTSEQQATAVAMLDRWDELYPHTTTLADRLGDEGALLTLQTVHGLSRADLEQLIEGVDDKIEFWSRPKNLTMHIGRDDDQPLVYRKIQSEIQRRKASANGSDAEFDYVGAKAAKERAWKNGDY